MKDERTAQVIETKRKPPIWSVKAGHRYKATFLGNDAKEKALEYARERYADLSVIEHATTRRKAAEQVG
jgi:hypothetical protein